MNIIIRIGNDACKKLRILIAYDKSTYSSTHVTVVSLPDISTQV